MATGHEHDGGESGLAEAVRFQRDLYLYWRAVAESRGLPLTARGFVARPALRRMRARLAAAESHSARESDLAEGEDARLLFLRRLAQRLGLLTLTDARLVAAEREKIERFLAYSLVERLHICLRVWVAGGWWPDAPDPNASPPRLLAPAPPRLALARRRLTNQLAALSSGGERVPAPPDRPAPQAGRSRRPSSAHRRELPPDAEAATVRAALLGPLTWLGIVTPETLPGSEVAALPPLTYTVTPAAALGQDGATPDLPERAGRVVAQPNFELVAFPPLTAPALFLLDTCAREVALDAAARYRLTRESFAQAHQRGWAASDVTARLEALTGVPLPANVRVTLADWERQGERLRLTDDITLLDVSNAALLDALLADRATAGWVARRLTPTAALLVPEHAARVRAWLLRRGELPAMAGPPRESPESAIG